MITKYVTEHPESDTEEQCEMFMVGSIEAVIAAIDKFDKDHEDAAPL